MKKLSILLFVSALLGINAKTTAQSINVKPTLEVFYFHVTNRCPTCLSIEANTRKVLETNFAKELKEGKIKFSVLNSDEAKNKTICEKYEAFGATLILVKYANGKEITENLTNFAFSYSRNQPDKFMAGLKEKIQNITK